MSDKKYRMQAGLNKSGEPILVFSVPMYNALIDSCRHLKAIAAMMDESDIRALAPLIVLAEYPKEDEVINKN